MIHDACAMWCIRTYEMIRNLQEFPPRACFSEITEKHPNLFFFVFRGKVWGLKSQNLLYQFPKPFFSVERFGRRSPRISQTFFFRGKVWGPKSKKIPKPFFSWKGLGAEIPKSSQTFFFVERFGGLKLPKLFRPFFFVESSGVFRNVNTQSKICPFLSEKPAHHLRCHPRCGCDQKKNKS